MIPFRRRPVVWAQPPEQVEHLHRYGREIRRRELRQPRLQGSGGDGRRRRQQFVIFPAAVVRRGDLAQEAPGRGLVRKSAQ